MHALVYHVPVFIKKYKNFTQFNGQGIEKHNDDAKRVYFQKSNKCDAARDILHLKHRQIVLRHHKREKRSHKKRNRSYWDKEIIEVRQKSAKACLKETENDGGNSSSTCNIEEDDANDCNDFPKRPSSN